MPIRSLNIYKCSVIRKGQLEKNWSEGVPGAYDAAELVRNVPKMSDRKCSHC